MSDQDPVTGQLLAPVSKRVGAYAIDAAALAVLSLGATLLAALGAGRSSTVLLALGVLLSLVALAYGLLVLLGLALRGRTPGKKAMGLVVLRSDGSAPVGLWRALLRQLVVGVLGPLNLVQLFLIPSHARRQGWHDRLADSVVYDERTQPRLPPLPPLSPPGRLIAAPLPAAPSAPPSLATGAPPPPGPVIPRREETAGESVGMVAPPPMAMAPPVADAPVAPPHSESVASAEPAPHTAVPPRRDTPVPPTPRGWTLVAVDGLEQGIDSLVLVGRDPDLTLVDGAARWAISDPELSVSKTHALFGLDDGAPWIEDWHSTNGVLLRREGDETELQAHARTPLRAGDELLLGDFVLRVEGN